MLHKLKPVPRALVILGIVGAIGYGAMQIDLSKALPKQEAEQAKEITVPRAAPVVVNPPAPEPAKKQAEVAVQAAVEAAQPTSNGLTPATSGGLGAVLKQGSK